MFSIVFDKSDIEILPSFANSLSLSRETPIVVANVLANPGSVFSILVIEPEVISPLAFI